LFHGQQLAPQRSGSPCYPFYLPQQLDELPARVAGLYGNDGKDQYEATQWFRKLLSIGEFAAATGAHNMYALPSVLQAYSHILWPLQHCCRAQPAD
jgi:hypothetical protein